MKKTLQHMPEFVSAMFVGLASSIILYAIYPECLSYRPFWDSLLGYLHEAIWLANNNFNYSLLAQQDHYAIGGPKVYFTSVWPTLNAMLIKNLSVERFLAVAHIINLVAAGTLVGATWLILKRESGSATAWIGALMLAFLPLWQTQALLINMDMPMYALGFAGIAAGLNGRPLKATALLCLAFMIKKSALLLAVILLVAVVLKAKRATDLKSFIPSVAVLALAFFSNMILNLMPFPPSSDTEGLILSNILDKWRFRYRGTLFWESNPELLLTVAMGFLGSLAWFTHSLWHETGVVHKRIWEKRACIAVPVMCLAGCIAITLLFVALDIFLPRYSLIAMPLAIMGFAGGISVMKVKYRFILASLVIAFFIVVRSGDRIYETDQIRWTPHPTDEISEYPDIKLWRMDGNRLDSSFAFINSLRLHQRAADELVVKYPDNTFVCSWPLVHILGLPELGYVDKSPRLLTFGRQALAWRGVTSYWQLSEEFKNKNKPSDFIWIWEPNTFNRLEPNWPDVEILEIVEEGPSKLIVFRFNQWPVQGNQSLARVNKD